MEDNKNTNQQQNNDQNNQSNNHDDGKKTFDEILKTEGYQAEFDRRIAKALETAKGKWAQDEEAKRLEAEKLANMNAEEKHAHELAKVNAEKDKAVKELNAFKLKAEATKIATEKGMDAALLEVIDFSSETAETLKPKLDKMADAYKKSVDEAMKKGFQQRSPQQRVFNGQSDEKAYLDKKYANNPYYKK